MLFRSIAAQVRRDEGETIAGVDLRTDPGPDLGLLDEIPHGRPHPVALAQQLDQAPAAEKPGAAGDQHRLLGR